MSYVGPTEPHQYACRTVRPDEESEEASPCFPSRDRARLCAYGAEAFSQNQAARNSYGFYQAGGALIGIDALLAMGNMLGFARRRPVTP